MNEEFEDDMRCERCEKEQKELVTRQGMLMTAYVEWVCQKCFKEIEGVSFEKYSIKENYEL